MAALDLFGRRGTLRILWELRGETSPTFRTLAVATGLPPATLNVRIKELREAGLLEAGKGYVATPLARELLVALGPLSDWSERWAKTLSPQAPDQ